MIPKCIVLIYSINFLILNEKFGSRNIIDIYLIYQIYIPLT